MNHLDEKFCGTIADVVGVFEVVEGRFLQRVAAVLVREEEEVFHVVKMPALPVSAAPSEELV